MEIIWSKEIDEILQIGLFLKEAGVNNWALTKKQALDALEHFAILEIPILGGDVYDNIKGTIRLSYDNWYCNPTQSESKKEFAVRSIARAQSYIEEFNGGKSDAIFFALVPDIR